MNPPDFQILLDHLFVMKRRLQEAMQDDPEITKEETRDLAATFLSATSHYQKLEQDVIRAGYHPVRVSGWPEELGLRYLHLLMEFYPAKEEEV